jgi:BMFP domain-containing protein YqiC
VPESVSALRRDLEQNFKGVLSGGLAKLDLVTREEFDVQAAVLKRTRAKLAALEKRLATLEGKDSSLGAVGGASLSVDTVDTDVARTGAIRIP